MRQIPRIGVTVVRVRKGFVISVWCSFKIFALLVPFSANAATVTVFDPSARRGGPIAQDFLDNQGENVSLVSTKHGASCVASRVMDIADSVYSAPDGTSVSFDDVTRSPASSIQAIARPGEPVAFRVQLKYSPDPSRPVEMEIEGKTLDLVTALEPSSDSLLLTDDTARLLAGALRRGISLTLRATSDATGRQVADRIMAPDMAGLDSCLIMLEGLPSVDDLPSSEMSDYDLADADTLGSDRLDTDDRVANTSNSMVPERVDAMAADESEPSRPVVPIPITGLRLEFTARPDPELRVDPSKLTHCRMRDIPDNVFLGRLTAVTGFFSQTQDVYVSFDDRGQLQRAYIPGIFDSDLTTGTNRARISLAADSNLPDRQNTVRGCLGNAPLEAPVCAISKSGIDGYTLAECGVLGMSQTREDYPDDFFVPFFRDATESMPTLMTAEDGRSGGTSFSRSAGSSRNVPSFRGLGGGGAGTGGVTSETSLGDNGFDTFIPGGGGNDVSIVPLPGALWMMLVAFTGLYGAGMLIQRKEQV